MPTVDYEKLHNKLMEDVRGLRDDFRSLWVGASDREAPAYEHAHDMTHLLIRQAEARERKQNAGT